MGIKNLLTVKKVINSFENSFLFLLLPKYDYSIKKQIQNPKKIYCIDNGFLTTMGFKFMDSEGKMLENLVAIELKRRSKEFYYSSDLQECDFVIREGSKITAALQVTWKLTNEDREREINGLAEAMDKFKLKEGLILTNDQEDEIKISGKKIVVKPVWKWLLETPTS
jgi:predicted AAA+ superfamily ATPase